MTRYYKVTGPAGECLNGGSGDWPLPVGDQPGAWRTVAGPLELCRTGLHLTTAEHLRTWIPNSRTFTVWAAETRGEILESPEKVAVRAARLLRPVDMGAYMAARETFADAERAAAIVQDRARIDASRRYDRVRGSHYFAMVSAAALPAGHPLAARAAAYAAGEAKARKVYDRALARAERAYRAELAPAELALATALEVLS